MLPRRGAVLLSSIVIATSALGASSCKKKTQGNTPDGAASASAAGGASAMLVDAAATAVPTATAPAQGAPESAPLPLPTPFTGSYRCFKGMQLVQVGRIVTSTMHSGTTDTVVACMVSGDDCTGTVREIQTTSGKAPKVMHVKPVTLHRDPNGNILYKVGTAEQSGPHGSKPAAADQTFCGRR